MFSYKNRPLYQLRRYVIIGKAIFDRRRYQIRFIKRATLIYLFISRVHLMNDLIQFNIYKSLKNREIFFSFQSKKYSIY